MNFYGCLNMFTKNVHATKDYMYKNLKTLIENKDLVVISGDKDSCVVILKRSDYDKKLQSMPQLQIQHLLILRNFKIFCVNLVGYTILQNLINLIR